MRLGLMTALMMAAAATSASASTLAVSGGVMTYTGSPGYVHNVHVTETAPGEIDLVRNSTTADVITAAAPDCSSSDADHFHCTGVTRVVMIGAERGDYLGWSGQSSLPITLIGGAGNDQELSGSQGADTIDGGSGDDYFYGYAGDDTLTGGPGSDQIYCGTGIDHADGGSGTDRLNCGDTGVPAAQNVKTLVGGTGSDTFDSSDANDSIDGGAGNDYVDDAGYGADSVDMGSGDDYVLATADGAADVYTGGPGNDTVDYGRYDGVTSASLDGAANDGAAGEADNVLSTENLSGGSGDDTLTGDDGANVISDRDGTNTIAGGGGNDIVTGGQGPDAVTGGAGNDDLTGGTGDDVLDGGDGNDRLHVDAGADVFKGGLGTDTVDATITRGCARALRVCRRGFSNSAYLSRVLSLNGIADDGIQNEGDNIDADGSVENVIGGPEDDVISGNAAVNVLSGGPGSDLIDAQDGTLASDVVSCGTGPDAISVDQFDTWDTHDSERCEDVSKGPIVKAQPTLTASTSPKARRFPPYRFVVSGELSAPGVPNRFACSGGAMVRVWIKAGSRTIASHLVRLASDCSYATQFDFAGKRAFRGRHTLTVRAGYEGGRYLFATAAEPGKVTVP